MRRLSSCASARSRVTRPVLSIRRAHRDDLPVILQIEKKSFGSDAWSAEAFLDYLAMPTTSIFVVAIREGKVIGYALAFCGKHAELDSLAVMPALRGQGTAEALMKRVFRSVVRRGYPAMGLCVRLENSGAIQLYRKLGFVRERRINDYYEDGGPAWRMRKHLIAPSGFAA